ncbi:MAG: glycosyltransferase [Thermoflexales bacterium]
MMRALYHVTIPDWPMANCEAVMQDIQALRRIAPGDSFHFYPARSPGTRIPRRLWGLNRLPAIWRAERSADFHHIFNPDPFPFPALHLLRRPIVYTVLGGVKDDHRRMAQQLARLARAIIVSSEDDLIRLRGWGISQSCFIQPAIDASRFSYSPPPRGAPFTLLAGSAPWTPEQFGSKGVNALLKAAQQRRDLRIIFLWRGVLFAEMMRRVGAMGVEMQVQVFNEPMDVNRLLAQAHAGVVLAERSDLVKAYPHSLLESLAAGKPVLISRAIPMSAWVEHLGLGVVVEQVTVEGALAAVDALRSRADAFPPEKLRAAVAHQSGRFLEQHRRVYHGVIAAQRDPAPNG